MRRTRRPAPRAAEDVDDDVDAAEMVESASRDTGAALGCRDVRCDVVHAGKGVARNRAGRGHDFRAVLRQHLDDRGANPFRSGRHERATSGELEIEARTAESPGGNFVAIECEAVAQLYGTAGEFAGEACIDGDVRPTTSTVSGSLVSWYFLVASVLQRAMASRPSRLADVRR